MRLIWIVCTRRWRSGPAAHGRAAQLGSRLGERARKAIGHVAGRGSAACAATGGMRPDPVNQTRSRTREGRNMRALLTSAGIKNSSIRDALVDLLGKPIADSNALFIPTALHPFSGGPGMVWRAICGKSPSPLCELGW